MVTKGMMPMRAILWYVQCMIGSLIMLNSAAAQTVEVGSVPAEAGPAPVWPMLLLLAICLMLAGRSRRNAPDDRR
jgi:hypothetical protein